jgi:hypothetical protein
MSRFKTFVNGVGMAPGDLNNIEADYETGFAVYKQLHRRVTTLGGPNGNAIAAGTYPLFTWDLWGGSTASATQLPQAVSDTVIDLDPARFAAGSRTVKLRTRLQLFTADIAAGIATSYTGRTFTLGLYGPVTASNLNVTAAGSLVAGSTAAITAPALNSQPVAVSADFTMPAAGLYLLQVVLSGGGLVANTFTSMTGRLHMRQV